MTPFTPEAGRKGDGRQSRWVSTDFTPRFKSTARESEIWSKQQLAQLEKFFNAEQNTTSLNQPTLTKQTIETGSEGSIVTGRESAVAGVTEANVHETRTRGPLRSPSNGTA